MNKVICVVHLFQLDSNNEEFALEQIGEVLETSKEELCETVLDMDPDEFAKLLGKTAFVKSVLVFMTGSAAKNDPDFQELSKLRGEEGGPDAAGQGEDDHSRRSEN